jgi:hypothetical protein
MLRLIAAVIGLGLAALWIVGMSVDATVWLTWTVGIGAALSLATVGIIPDQQGSAWAALCLGALASGLLALWIVGLRLNATAWLAWWTFAAALLTGLSAFGAAFQGLLGEARTRDVI